MHSHRLRSSTKLLFLLASFNPKLCDLRVMLCASPLALSLGFSAKSSQRDSSLIFYRIHRANAGCYEALGKPE